jgi:hypothetical protein
MLRVPPTIKFTAFLNNKPHSYRSKHYCIRYVMCMCMCMSGYICMKVFIYVFVHENRLPSAGLRETMKKDDVKTTINQFALVNAFHLICHEVERSTLDRIVAGEQGPANFRNPEKCGLYVVLSRARTLNGVSLAYHLTVITYFS